MRLRVLGNRVLVRPIIPKTELPEGLITPEAYEYLVPTSGRVVGVGLGFTHPGFPSHADLLGRIVTFSQQAGQDVTFQGENFLILNADDLTAILEKE